MKKFRLAPQLAAAFMAAALLGACSGKSNNPPSASTFEPTLTAPATLDDVVDLYSAYVNTPELWGAYNVHDPSVMHADDGYWYAYSTDASYGDVHEVGIQVRRSADLIQWEYLGSALGGTIPAMGAAFISEHGGTAYSSVWAPYAMKVGDQYRMYYSLSSPSPRLSVIGLLTSDSPEGPWTEQGLVVTSLDDTSIQTNAIDPSVVVTPDGQYWMTYGSAWDGIYVLQLDPETGLAKTDGDKGVRIAQRGVTDGVANGNIEGSEIIYNADLDKYFLFISYDWLSTKYNIRVGRGDHPWGPFYDYKGVDMNEFSDNVPMIVAPYKFTGHGGWQGTAHNAAFQDPDSGQWFIAHQGRPAINPAYFQMHVRKLAWTEDGWPIASPERYAGVEQTTISSDELVGNWDQIVLGYSVVPGYADEQTDPQLQVAFNLHIDAAGTLNGDAASTWTFAEPWLEMHWSNGYTDKVYVERGRDWENKVASTLLFTGLNGDGTAIWGKKLDSN